MADITPRVPDPSSVDIWVYNEGESDTLISAVGGFNEPSGDITASVLTIKADVLNTSANPLDGILAFGKSQDGPWDFVTGWVQDTQSSYRYNASYSIPDELKNQSELYLRLNKSGTIYISDPITNALADSSSGSSYQVGDTVLYGGIECVIAYDAGSEQSWGRYILCEKHDLNHYEPDSGTGGVDEEYVGKQWGIYNQSDPEADGIGIGTGKDNTDYLIGRYNTNTYLWYYVNQHRTNTGKPWHVPSNDELSILYDNLSQIGNFSTSTLSWYWSSSEYTSQRAWYQYFSTGNQYGTPKYEEHIRVRLVCYATEADLPPKPQTETIEMTCETEGAEIRYTLDGSEPTETSELYSAPIEVAPPATIKARGFKDGMLDSDIAEYVVTVPVDSIGYNGDTIGYNGDEVGYLIGA